MAVSRSPQKTRSNSSEKYFIRKKTKGSPKGWEVVNAKTLDVSEGFVFGSESGARLYAKRKKYTIV